MNPEIQALVERLEVEINEIEREANAGIVRTRELLSLFPDNAVLIQFFAYFNSTLFFIQNAFRRIQTALETLEIEERENNNVSAELIRETAEDLATLLGELLEAKIRTNNYRRRLDN